MIETCAWDDCEPAVHAIVYAYAPADADVRLTLPFADFGPTHPSFGAPPVALHDVASTDDHVSVATSPAVSAVGLAARVTDGNVKVTEVWADVEPAADVQSKAYV